ncbi:MAG TPA: CSLREA domain-containing protein [Verrucomicrobiales bacterium]|nr:CSLREA domain-containing protein [Verrucomicrobiales bacterium]
MKKRPCSLILLPACVGFAATFIFCSQVLSQITVTTAADENDAPAGDQVSLREAIRDSASGGQITFDAALSGKVVVLTAGEMVVTGKTLTVSAPDGMVIEARGLSRIFRVEAGAGLNLTGLTLQGGKAPADGGAILNAGTLNLTDCVLRDNRAANGAPGSNGSPGVAPPSGGFDSVFPGSGGTGGTGARGGAVSSTGSLTVLRCRFTGNAAGNGGTGGNGGNVPNGSAIFPGGSAGAGGAGGPGGAIYSSGSLLLSECLFEANTTGAGGSGGSDGYPQTPFPFGSGNGGTSGYGGAVHQTGSVSVERCSFIENACPPGGLRGPTGIRGGSSGSGAALFWSTGTATLTNCTIAGNRTGESGTNQGGEGGGAVAAGSGTLLRLVHCTVTRNLAARVRPGSDFVSWVTSTAAGIVSAAPVQCDNCILSGNLADRSTDNGVPVWQEVNFSPGTQRTVTPATPLGGAAGEDAQLGPILLSASPLPVLIPAAASPALNAGVVLTNPPAVDQRGQPRAAGAPDLGAVEIQPLEGSTLTRQSIAFAPPAQVQLTSIPLDIEVSATASSGLPVSLELLSGPATLNGGTLTLAAPGMVALRASQAGTETEAAALSVVRVIEVSGILQTIPFTPAQSYPVYSTSPTTVTLPEKTSAGHNVGWSVVGSPGAGISLNGNVVTATGTGSVQIKGEHAGAGLYAPVTSTWTLTFVPGTVWWETPTLPFEPLSFIFVEGSTHGLNLTASISVRHNAPVPVPSLPGGLIATPSSIPAGQTSIVCQLTLPANQGLTTYTEVITTGNPAPRNLYLVLANRTQVRLHVFAPSVVTAGVSAQVDLEAPGVLSYPPPDLSARSVTVSAADFDNPNINIPITLDSATNTGVPWRKRLQVTFPPVNRRARLTVTTDDGISGQAINSLTFQATPIQIEGGAVVDTNADGDGINDIVEAALQRTPDQFDQPPLTVTPNAAGLLAVLASRPRDLKGWTVVIETSTDLQTWTPAPAASTTITPNPDGTTERVTVLLPAGPAKHYVRLRATIPP